MATVTQILDRACRITGLYSTGTERALALAALQDAYRRSVMDSECSLVNTSYTFVSSGDDYTFATILTELPLRLTHVSLTSQGGYMPMQQISLQELLDFRALGTTSGTPMYYATIGFEGIAFYPNPSAGDEVTIWWIDDVPTLVETGPAAGQESTPSKLPSAFHWSVLLPATVLEMLDKDQRLTESSTWHQRYELALAKLQEHMGQMGGTANRAYLAKSSYRNRGSAERYR